MLAIVRNAWIDETRSRHRRDEVLVPENEGFEVGDTGTDRDSTGGRSRARWDGCRRSNGSPWRWC